MVFSCLGVAVALVTRASSDSPRNVSGGYDLATEGITGRLVGEPAPGRTVGSPDVPRALAFASANVSELTASINRSEAFDAAELVTIASLRQAVETSREVCAGVPRPTTAEDILDTQAFRISQDGAVADVRITEFEDCLLYTSPSPRDKRQSRMPSSA